MKYDSISGLFTAIADEIRAKEGSSELINPQDLPERVKNLSGIPNVPALECWKIDMSSSSVEDKQNYLYELTGLASGVNYPMCGKCIILSELDGNIYGGIGPLLIVGSGDEEVMANIFYIAFMNVGEQTYFVENIHYFRENCLDICGEQISLSNFLSMVAQAQSYENQVS